MSNLGRPKKVSTPTEKPVVKCKCIRCGKTNIADFYTTKDPDRGNAGKLAYCKTCMKEIFQNYLKKYKDDTNLAFYYLCRKMDIPYIHDNYLGAVKNISNKESTIQGIDNIIPAYMKGLAFSDTNGWGYTFDDSQGEANIEGLASFDAFTKVMRNRKLANNTSNDEYEVIEYDTGFLQSKWGIFDNDDLAYLESEYLDWEDKLGGQIGEKSIDIIVKQICLQTLDIQKARENGDDVTKLIKTLRELMSDGGLVEKQSQASDISRGSVGQRIAEIERIRPVYAPDPELQDVDKMRDIIYGFAGATTRALGKSNFYTKKLEEIFDGYTIDIIEDKIPTEDGVNTDE